MERAAILAGPVRIEITGLTLTPGTVTASAALDDQATLFTTRLAEELGPDGWHWSASTTDGRLAEEIGTPPSRV